VRPSIRLTVASGISSSLMMSCLRSRSLWSTEAPAGVQSWSSSASEKLAADPEQPYWRKLSVVAARIAQSCQKPIHSQDNLGITADSTCIRVSTQLLRWAVRQPGRAVVFWQHAGTPGIRICCIEAPCRLTWHPCRTDGGLHAGSGKHESKPATCSLSSPSGLMPSFSAALRRATLLSSASTQNMREQRLRSQASCRSTAKGKLS
jgi:hypothetical protein